MKKIIAILMFVFSLVSNPGVSQDNRNTNDQTSVFLSWDMEFDSDSKPDAYTIDVDKQTMKLRIVIEANITAGKLVIEIFDPKGDKQGNFSVATQSVSRKNEEAMGSLNKTVTEPQVGKWTVKVVPIKATGKLIMQTYHYQ